MGHSINHGRFCDLPLALCRCHRGEGNGTVDRCVRFGSESGIRISGRRLFLERNVVMDALAMTKSQAVAGTAQSRENRR
jgi:hypothetical protein